MNDHKKYLDEAQSKLFDKYGVFFAFSNEQYEESAKPGVEYVTPGMGMICPKEHVKTVITELGEIHKKAREMDMQQNSRRDIIHRELANFECQISGDVDDAVDALENYGITREEVEEEYKVFFAECVEHDRF